MLVAPSFLYKIEVPPPGPGQAPVSAWELATRLSYFLWSSAPDEELRRAAAAGRLADPEALVAEMRRMLHAVVRDGTGKKADPGVWAAGKTGTTDGHRDAWFIGFTDRCVCGVWLGNPSPSTPMNGVSGGGLPAEVWRGIMAAVAAEDRRARKRR